MASEAEPAPLNAGQIIEPTDRSIPPVMMIGVITSAKRPISTANRVISNAFPDVSKLLPVNAEYQAFDGDDDEQYPLIVREQPFAPGLFGLKRGLCL